MTDIMDAVSHFSDRLHATSDAAEIRAAFDDHTASSFLRDFLKHELDQISRRPDHIVRRAAGQISFTLINTVDYEYTVRLALPSTGGPGRLKWLGERQIIRFRGPGTAMVRMLRAPDDVDINQFRPGVELTETPIQAIGDGGIVEVADGHGLIDIVSFDRPMIIEFVTTHANGVELYWTFDEQRRSIHAELAALSASRLQNVIEIAHRMGRAIPDRVYDRLVDDRNTQTRLLAIQSMLVERHPDAFVHLNEAIGSPNQILAMGGAAILDALTKQAELQGAA